MVSKLQFTFNDSVEYDYFSLDAMGYGITILPLDLFSVSAI